MRVLVRLPFAALACALSVSACSKSTEAPVATTVAVTPSSALTFASINQAVQLSAVVLNQNADTMAGLIPTWSSSNTAVATVSATGLVTAKGNGSATIIATSGSIHTDIAATVAQVATTLAKAGEGQSGTVGQALPAPVSVHLTDALGSAIAGASVTFAVTSGAGSLGTPTGMTNATGDFSTTWTMGTNVAIAQTATATSGALVSGFAATPVAGPVAAVGILTGNNQSGATSNPVTVRPSVKVSDSFGNPKQNVSVLFQVTGGGGSVTGATQFTDAAGAVTVGGWTLGSSAGANTLSATTQGGVAASISFNATAVAPGSPTSVAVLSGNNQTALVGYRTNVRPAVRVLDAASLPVANVSVTFGGLTGGGSLTTATVNTNAQGIAQVGGWTVGAAPGANTVTATVASGGITGNPITFAATGASPTFNITIINIGPAFSVAVQTAFDSAVAKWQRILYQDVQDASVSIPVNGCVTGQPAFNQVVDDVVIFAKIDSIDGPSNIIGSAGFCVYRNPGSLIPAVGVMRFDSADLSNLNATNRLKDVILHEMGHVLGYGTLWPSTIQPGFPGIGCLQNPSSAGNPVDTYYSCSEALAMFDSIGGAAYTLGNKVPVENGVGQGSFNSHWRERTFDEELMTPIIEAAGVLNPLSVLSLASMTDMGYAVNYAAADPYPHPTGYNLLRAGEAGPVIDLSNDIWIGPLYEVNSRGQMRRVR